MSDLQQEMEAFFAEYTKRWNDQDDYSSLIEMWDQDDDTPFYRGMEKPGFFDTWERLKLYWDPVRKLRSSSWSPALPLLSGQGQGESRLSGLSPSVWRPWSGWPPVCSSWGWS